MLHTAAETTRDTDLHIPLSEDGPQRSLCPMIFALHRRDSLGTALLAALCASPTGFARQQLCLSDIEQILDYFNLPSNFLRNNLEILVMELVSFSERSDRSKSQGEQSFDEALSFTPLLPSVLLLIREASAHFTAYNVLYALKNRPPMWVLAHGSAYFVLLEPPVSGEATRVREGRYTVPFCVFLDRPQVLRYAGDSYSYEKKDAFLDALMSAKAGSPPTKSISCVGTSSDWTGKTYEARELGGLDEYDDAADVCCDRLSSALTPESNQGLCVDALPRALKELGLSMIWIHCPVSIYEDDVEHEGFIAAATHVMQVSW